MSFVPPPTRIKKLERAGIRQVADHEIFAVHAVRYEGLPRDVTILSTRDWCNVIAETPSRDVVLVWQFRFGSDDLSLEIPGGVIDPGEAPETAARRELLEETGYEADAIELLSVVQPNPAIQTNRCYTYVARGARPTGQTAFDELEDLEVALVARRDLATLLDSGQIGHSLVVCALEAYLRRTT